MFKHTLHPERMNTLIKNASYAVRGEVLLVALDLEERLKKGEDLPFDEIIYCNIGNPQQLKQKPITFNREVLSLVQSPQLLEHPKVGELFASDAIERAQLLVDNIDGGIGSYSHSQGIPIVRKHIAEFIEQRDGHPSDANDIFLYDGAGQGITAVLRLLIRGETDGVMIPIPQYPLYSAAIAMMGGRQVNYYLEEENHWGLNLDSLQESLDQARNDGTDVRALTVINPGNPTGACLSESDMQKIVQLCADEGLVLLADEVYQVNVYEPDEHPWHSFKKVVCDMEMQDKVELFSFHSISKGVTGECGLRSGYLEAVNMHPEIHDQLYKLSSVNLCPNTAGQVMMDLMVKTPEEGDASAEQFYKERQDIFDSMQRRAKVLGDALNELPGMSCQMPQGAMYAFPKVELPAKAVEKAQSLNKAPDAFYAVEMLKRCGVCVVPGSGFGQKDGTFHFRTTFLPGEDKMDSVVARVAEFHTEFLEEYA